MQFSQIIDVDQAHVDYTFECPYCVSTFENDRRPRSDDIPLNAINSPL